MDAEAGHALDQRVRQRFSQQARKKGLAAAADDDLRHMLAARRLQYLLDEILPGHPAGFGAQAFRQLERRRESLGYLGTRRRTVGAFDRDHQPRRVEPRRQARRRAHDLLGQAVGADADQQPLGGLPGAFDRILLEIVDHLVVDAVGGAAQRHLAKRGQVAQPEEAVDGALGILGKVDLAFLQPLDQLGRREVDQQHVVGALAG